MFSSDTTTTTTDLFCNSELYSVDESLSIFDHFTPQNILSSSPPSDLLGTLTLSQQIPTGMYPSFSDFQISDAVKTENFFDQTSSMARSYSAIENAGRYMQRSFSSNSVEGKPNQLPFNIPVMDSSNLHYNTLSSPENPFFSGQMRRVYSTGDLQNNFEMQRSSENSTVSEEHNNFKVGRYSAEERKEKISKYRAKRNQRNFTKTIKYACRKTLADSRPRIRGRFARNDEVVEIPNIEDDDSDLWKLDGLHEKDQEASMTMSSFMVQQPLLQYSASSTFFW
ncbi:PREDICTED: two-component response regulator-like APRR1 [Camelina sativa]|uniref:Two-component response regulator-like APRR1 n=1 Tax=Camelina sativa TaxID=90675 RepID=A0ABM1QLQ6_CAMSA|nr:PREDICTED: two-component response regulator-like APRR1 [Camelina sativa]